MLVTIDTFGTTLLPYTHYEFGKNKILDVLQIEREGRIGYLLFYSLRGDVLCRISYFSGDLPYYLALQLRQAFDYILSDGSSIDEKFLNSLVRQLIYYKRRCVKSKK